MALVTASAFWWIEYSSIHIHGSSSRIFASMALQQKPAGTRRRELTCAGSNGNDLHFQEEELWGFKLKRS